MDPLSFTVAASQLLGAVNTVIVIVGKYNEEMNKTPRDLLRFTEELRGLRHVLESLESLVLEAKKSNLSADPKIRALIPLYEPLTLYLDDIKLLQDRLETPSWHTGSRRRRSIVTALGWPLREDEGKRELEKMKAFREQLKDAMQVDTLHLTLANHKILAENQRILTELVRSWRNNEKTSHRRELHRWLAAPDPTTNHQNALKQRSGATGAWLTQSKQFSDWIDSPKSFLWLYGIAGCGKTILTTTAIENITTSTRSDPARAVAYFYFDFTDGEKQLPMKTIRSLLKQLSFQCPETPHVLSVLYASCEEIDRQPSADELLDALRHIMNSFYDIYIVLDALDECSMQEELLDLLDRIVSWRVDHLHILVSSRPERAIEESLRRITKEENRIKVSKDLINDDIRTYIQSRLGTDSKLRRWDKYPDVKGDIEDKLMHKAEGMFRLVACQLDELGSCLNRPQLQQRLKTLPKTLDTMYASMLSRIPEEHELAAVTILRWLTYSARPLSTEEVAEGLCVDMDDDQRFDPMRRYPDPRDMLEICPSLVIATESGKGDSECQLFDNQMQLAHYSVKEFLVSKNIQKLAPVYSIKELEANSSLAESCLAYLLSFGDANAVGPEFLDEYPLAGYAAQHWIQHAKVAKDHERVIELMMELFDDENPAYTNWVCVYNPDRPWQQPGEAVSTQADGANDHSPPAFYMASLCGLESVTKILLDSGADLHAVAGECGNALQAAARGGHEAVVKQLLDAGADVNSLAGLHGTALEAAAYHGHEAVARCLIRAGAGVNKSGGKYSNPLNAASREGHVSIIKILLDAGADVSLGGGFYGFALQAAAFYGHEQVVRALLAGGADVNQKSGGIYGTALQAAARNGYEHVVRLLLDAGAHADDTSGMYHTALQSAARGAQCAVMKTLLDAGADVNSRGGKYGNALQSACLVDDSKAVQQLLDAGANVNAVDGVYGTALQAACSHGHDKVVDVLLHHKADVNVKGGYYGSSIVAASKNGHDRIVKRLLEAGAEVRGLTVSITVLSAGHKEALQRLREAGANIITDSDLATGAPGEEVEDVQPHMGQMSTIEEDVEGVKLTDDVDIEQAALTVKFCDECGKPIPDGARYYHCGICLNDDWDSCADCVQQGFPCRDRRHKMVPRCIRNGVIRDIT